MEAGAGAGSTFGGTLPTTGIMANAPEATTPSAHDDDARHSHSTNAPSFTQKAVGAGSPVQQYQLITLDGHQKVQQSHGLTGDGYLKDVKSLGTRFHEECHETDLPSPRLRSSRMFKGKGKEPILVEPEAKKPLRLLDLPVDILKDIVKEVTHTNDLTSLARCHSALHRLTIPHIYSRFDIVWPDSSTHSEPRSGVDALTYGLATLVMAEEIFDEAPGQRQEHSNRFNPGGYGEASDLTVRRRIGNHYAQFTRKFSLGNGPTDWVQEYLISKEGGKMLGTLVALALARMRSLETFIWDMPTGILRDVWLSLASLGQGRAGQPCRLEKVWVRWHDNSTTGTPSLHPPPRDPDVQNAPQPPLPLGHPALDRVEHPNFSVLPPLKSLSVLNIDELAYLDEMAVLIGKSLDKLRELRVGFTRLATAASWARPWEGSSGLQQVDYDNPTAGSYTIGEKRLGGPLGVLTGFVYDMREQRPPHIQRARKRSSHKPTLSAHAPPPPPPQTPTPTDASENIHSPPQPEAAAEPGDSSFNLTVISGALPDVPSNAPSPTTPQSQAMLYENDPLIATSSHNSSPQASSPLQTPRLPPAHATSGEIPDPIGSPNIETPAEEEEEEDVPEPSRPRYNSTLKLETLELEHVYLYVPGLQKSIDWTHLTSLTLLDCIYHEELWKTLRKTFAPTPRSPIYPATRHIPSSTKKGRISFAASSEFDYPLKLKKIHTDDVSNALISFIKETLAPDSLETLFLQESPFPSSSVPISTIYKGALRRHRASLKRVLIESSEKGTDGQPVENSNNWKRWMFTREILNFIGSGKMPELRELGMALDYRHWHFFLQNLPNIPHLRSLYIPFIANHPNGHQLAPKDLADSIVTIVALRPEIELCYMGISNKCFEILENRLVNGRGEPQMDLDGDGAGSENEDDDDEEDEDDDDDVVEVVEDVEDLDDATESDGELVEDEDEDDDDEYDDSEDDGEGEGRRGAIRLRLREILFYDDKIAVFKARHGRL